MTDSQALWLDMWEETHFLPWMNLAEGQLFPNLALSCITSWMKSLITFLSQNFPGDGEVARLVKDSPCEHEDLSSNPQTHTKSGVHLLPQHWGGRGNQIPEGHCSV